MKKLLTLLSLLALAAPLAAQTTARLIPFQGRLTDQNNVAYNTGQYTIIFALYDQPVGGALLWSERHEKVGVINGMVNVFLGSIRSFDAPGGTNVPVTFSTTRYLGITIDVDGNANTPDPEMIPRQMIIPAFWAKTADNATQLNGYDWTPIFGVNNPTVDLPGSKIGAGTIPGTALAANTITADRMANNSIGGAQVVDGSLGVAKLAANTLSLTNFTPRLVVTNAPTSAGGVAVSALSPEGGTLNFPDANASFIGDVQNMTVTLATTGRPVFIGLVPDQASNKMSIIEARGSSSGGHYDLGFSINLNGTPIANTRYVHGIDGGNYAHNYPPSSLSTIVLLPSGSHTFTLKVHYGGNGTLVGYRVQSCRLIAFEF